MNHGAAIDSVVRALDQAMDSDPQETAEWTDALAATADHALERAGDGGPGQSGAWRAWGAYRQLRVGRRDFRGRVQPFLPGG